MAVPTIHHLPVARLLMEAGIDVLIEKPLATSLAEADELVPVSPRSDLLRRMAQHRGHVAGGIGVRRGRVACRLLPLFVQVLAGP